MTPAAATIDAPNAADTVHDKQAVGKWQWDGSQAIGGPGNHAWNAALSGATRGSLLIVGPPRRTAVGG